MTEGMPRFENPIESVDDLEKKVLSLTNEVRRNFGRLDGVKTDQLAATAEGQSKLLRAYQALDTLKNSAGSLFLATYFGAEPLIRYLENGSMSEQQISNATSSLTSIGLSAALIMIYAGSAIFGKKKREILSQVNEGE